MFDQKQRFACNNKAQNFQLRGKVTKLICQKKCFTYKELKYWILLMTDFKVSMDEIVMNCKPYIYHFGAESISLKNHTNEYYKCKTALH